MSRDIDAILSKIQQQIDEQKHQLKDLEKRIDAAISEGQAIISTDHTARSAGGISRGQWGYSKGTAEGALSVMEMLGSNATIAPAKSLSDPLVKLMRKLRLL